jgi:hypothetical protein
MNLSTEALNRAEYNTMVGVGSNGTGSSIQTAKPFAQANGRSGASSTNGNRLNQLAPVVVMQHALSNSADRRMRRPPVG